MSLSLSNLVARITGTARPPYAVRIVPGIQVEGSLSCSGDVEVLASCSCSVRTEGAFRLYEEAMMKHPVVAGKAEIQGTLEASLRVGEEADFAGSSRYRGEAKAKSMRIAPGADVDMRLELGPAAESSKHDSPVISIRPSTRNENPRKRVEIDLGNL